MNELSLRIITASVLFIGAIVWVFWLPAMWFDAVLGLIAVAATVELLRMLNMPHRRWFNFVAVLMWGLLVVSHGVVAMLPVAWLTLMVGWLLILVLGTKDGEIESSFRALSYAQWMMSWLILFVFVLMQLHAHEDGIVFIAGACVGVWAADIGAYFTGKKWGQRKLCSAISPGKSWEGFIGGALFGIAAACFVWLNYMAMSWPVALLLGSLLVIAAVLGDLAESALKRAVGVKDSGTMLPGHGGLLDRIDALLPAIPLVGLIWMIFA
ncbi:MAG: phosphatidate cytidylyltransferase [Mariprofundaceae bacterium]